MRTTQMDLTTWDILLLENEKAKANSNGAMGKCTMANGKTTKSKAVESGKDPTAYPM